MKIINLTATPQFFRNGLRNDTHILFNYIRLHRMAIQRRFFNDRKVTDARHGKIERAWNRRSGKRQYVNRRKFFFQLFLLGNTESLFFVYDQKA